MDKLEYFRFMEETFKEIEVIVKRKNNDYTSNSDDPFANFRESEKVKVPTEVGVFLRMSDKFQRLRSYLTKGQLEVANEGYEDALKDIIGYSVAMLALLKEKK